MFRTFRRKFLSSPLDQMLKKCAKRGGSRVLLGWNRGLGDIALGIFPIIQRIKEFLPHAKISFITRKDLKDGFSLLQGIDVIIDPELERGEKWDFSESIKKLGLKEKDFDLIIPAPSPTDWMMGSRGKVIPKLTWEPSFQDLWKKFDLPDGYMYIGVQAVVETKYGVWRNWPLEKWKELFSLLETLPNVKVLLLGGDEKTPFQHKNIIDLRGKTTLFELISIVKQKCSQIVLPDSGILSMVYYLDQNFPIHVVSLWADPNHGILKQAVGSPNKELRHTPLVGDLRDLGTLEVQKVMNTLFPLKPLKACAYAKDVSTDQCERAGAVLLAGGHGSRLGHQGPKGTFPVLGKSLFEWLCVEAPRENFPIAVMVSPENHEQTVRFFQKHHFFGKEIYFFEQEVMPFLDAKKRETKIFAPCGNGSFFSSFVQSGLYEKFLRMGVDALNIIPVDNPLGTIADSKLISFLRSAKSDVVVKCIEKGEGVEKMGALVQREGKLEIQEYIYRGSEFPKYFNTGAMATSLEFIKKVSEKTLPFHLVKKQIPGTRKWGWKKESFIFDVLPYGKATALCYEKSCFGPIKSAGQVDQIKVFLQPNGEG